VLRASSTFRTVERTRLVRFLLMTVRRPATRVAFFAELVFAINHFPEVETFDPGSLPNRRSHVETAPGYGTRFHFVLDLPLAGEAQFG